MKKRIIVGDTHGHSTWKEVYDKEQPDIFIMLGDYCDSFSVISEDQLSNFKNIIACKKEHEAKYGKGTFIMLIGNHDFHYFNCDEICERYSGWNPHTYNMMAPELSNALDHGMKFIHIDETNKTIFSHAGVSNTWFKKRAKIKSLGFVNTIGFRYFTFTYNGRGDSYGSSLYNGPIWIRPWTLQNDLYKDSNNEVWNQIVGHTPTKDPKTYADGKLVTIDCMPYRYLVQYLDDDGKLISQSLV